MPGLSFGLQLGLLASSRLPAWYTKGKLDGVDPTFWADFVNQRYAVSGVAKTFAEVFTHTRASTKTFIGSNGLMQTAAIDEPVFEYDPVTLLPMGLDNEEQRTNVLKHSSSPVTSWFGVGATTSAAAGTMLGYFSGGIAVASAGATWNRARPDNISWTNAVVQSWTAFVKAGTSGKIRVNFNDTVAATETSMSGTLGAVLTATATAAGAVTHDTTISLGGGYYILSGTFTPNSTMVGQGQFAVGPNSAVVGETIDLFGAQFEAGAFPTSFIETTTGAVTRSADLTQNSAANAAGFGWYTQAQGSVYENYSINGNTGAGGYPRIWEILNAASPFNDFFIGIYAQALSNGRPRVDINAGGVAQMQNNVIVTQPVKTSLKMVGAATLNDGQIAYQNTLGFLDTAMTMPTNLDTLRLQVNMTHKDFRFYPIRGLNASIQALTA